MTDAATIGPIMKQIGEVLNKHDGDTQGAVLANALAVWIAGHRMKDGTDPTGLRMSALEGIVELAVKMVPLVDQARERRDKKKDTMQ